MIKKRALLSAVGILVFACFSTLGLISAPSEKHDLTLTLETNKSSLVLGEIVDVSFLLKNVSQKKLAFFSGFSVGSGYLQVFVSFENGIFRRYSGPEWGLDGISTFTQLEPNDIAKTSTPILWNNVPIFENIVPSAHESIRKEQITDDYVFSKPGSYMLKAILLRPNSTKIESNLVKITVEEPTGADLDIWNIMKDRGDIGYFVQHGDVPPKKYPVKTFEDDVRELLHQFPNSRMAEKMRNSLQVYGVKKAKRNEREKKRYTNN